MALELDEAKHAQGATQLLPPGKAWTLKPDGNLARLLAALGVELGKLELRACELLEEINPRTSVELLSNWETVLGLPGECGTLAETLAGRQFAAHAKLIATAGQSPAYFVMVAEAIGFAIEIEEYEPFRVGRGRAGDRLNGEEWQFAWTVHAPEFTPRFLRSGEGSVGDPLISFDNAPLACVLQELRPVHTVLLVSFDLPFEGYAPWDVFVLGPAIAELVSGTDEVLVVT
jgi:uncharacterized protein YmfQ (DUF2313 family)